MIIMLDPERQSERSKSGSLHLVRRFAALAVLLLTACVSQPFNGVALDPSEPAPALRLTDSTGRQFDLADQRGKVVLLFFGYTHCPDICPTTLVDWKRAGDSLGKKREQVRFVFISVDPERDSTAAVQRYAARFSPDILGLTGTRTQIDSVMRTWKIAAYRDGPVRDTGSTYLMAHPSQVFVVDREGQLRLLHRAGLTPSQIASDIRVLL
jgi:protein SCO1